jgi:hypothetical protein
MFDAETIGAIAKLAARLKCTSAALQAVAEVESAGVVFALVKGKQEPLIRWEGHYFFARLDEVERKEAVRQGLASPNAGGVKNPASQAKRWEIVTRASKINRQAALESFSIGLGQVMTAHWGEAGLDRVEDLIALARSGAAGQIELMAKFIDKAGLADELQRLDVTAFARGYNGPAFKRNGYHLKMAAAYKRLTGAAPVSKATGMLRMGSSGKRVRELQKLLVRAGHAVTVDDEYGTATRDAVKAFQKAQRITADGICGPETFRRLVAFKQAPDEDLGAKGITEIKEAKEGLGGIVGGGAIEVASQKVEEVADKVSWIPGLEWLGTILTVIAVLLVVGGLAWVAWGWVKARRTDEGDVESVTITPADDIDPVLA